MPQGDSSDKPVKPIRIFLILLLTNLLVLLFILIVPSGQLNLPGGMELKFVSLDDLLHYEEVEAKDITDIVNQVEETLLQDSLELDSAQVKRDTIILKEPNPNVKIEYEIKGRHPMADFFEALKACEAYGTMLRIAHYGDSQIEGDRITAAIRNNFQKQFGGGGPGMVEPEDPSGMRITVKQEMSEDGKKYAAFGNKTAKLDNKLYGIGGTAFRFGIEDRPQDTTATPDSTSIVTVDSVQTFTSWIKYSRAKRSYATVKKYTNAKLLYRTGQVPSLVQSLWNEQSRIDTLDADTVGMLMIKGVTGPSLEMRLDPANAPDIFGVALDADSGIAVDNYAMRGSSGTEFIKINSKHLDIQLKLLNTKLVVLQYGINVVPYIDDDKEITYYENLFYRQIRHIKKHYPNRSVLVVSLSDMAKKEGTQYVSYPSVVKMRDAQKRAAFKAGCAFWDLLAAMGGENSMVSWVLNDPPLAAKDFTHFNYRGSNLIAKMLYDAILLEYIRYKKKDKAKS